MHLNSPLTPDRLHAQAARTKILIMDVDGVLTNGRLYLLPLPDGTLTETKGFDSQDGIALRWLTWYGIKTGVISGRESPATAGRASQVGMTWVFQGHIEKIPLFEQIVKESGVSADEIAYVGDDFTDVVLFRRAGLAIATANARPEVKQSAHVVTEAAGGSGAIREVAELLLKGHGKWEELLKKYEVTP
jgi:3-deoxy-D-manno-octulosonate 8-phosphate phosphatase (KDO 8-P phosphatase)